MRNLRINPIIAIIILLAIVGIGLNFIDFLQEIIITVIIGFVIFLGYNWYIRSNKSSGNNERQAYSKAVKQSKKKYASKSPTDFLQKKSSPQQNMTSRKKRKQSTSSHLTVIQGDKGKKKDKASY